MFGAYCFPLLHRKRSSCQLLFSFFFGEHSILIQDIVHVNVKTRAEKPSSRQFFQRDFNELHLSIKHSLMLVICLSANRLSCVYLNKLEKGRLVSLFYSKYTTSGVSSSNKERWNEYAPTRPKTARNLRTNRVRCSFCCNLCSSSQELPFVIRICYKLNCARAAARSTWSLVGDL